VYNEFIQDKHHIHMNSTKWLTLTEYVKFLGREGLCKVEDSPKGWFIQLIQRDPEQVRLSGESTCKFFIKPFRALSSRRSCAS
jgi:hypothetical protein